MWLHLYCTCSYFLLSLFCYRKMEIMAFIFFAVPLVLLVLLCLTVVRYVVSLVLPLQERVNNVKIRVEAEVCTVY